MTRAMAAQHGPEGIRVNCVAPGMVFTPMVRGRGMTDEMRQARVNQNLLKVEGTGWDVGYGKFPGRTLVGDSAEANWITQLSCSFAAKRRDGLLGSSCLLMVVYVDSFSFKLDCLLNVYFHRPRLAKQIGQRSKQILLRKQQQVSRMRLRNKSLQITDIQYNTIIFT